MTKRERRELLTLMYFLPRSKGKIRHQVEVFLAEVTSGRGTLDFTSDRYVNWVYWFDERELHTFLGPEGLNILSWESLRNGKRKYTVNLARVKQLVKERIDAGIAAGDEHILASLHSPDYKCEALPLKRIFPEYKNVMKKLWRRAWLAGRQAAERECPYAPRPGLGCHSLGVSSQAVSVEPAAVVSNLTAGSNAA